MTNVSTSTAASIDVDKALGSAAIDLLDAVGSLDARSTLLRIDGDDVIVEAVHDVDGRATLLDWRGPVRDQPLLVEAMRSAAVVVGGPVPSERLPAELSDALGDVRHSLVIPVCLAEQPEGFLMVFRRHPRPFILDDAATLQLLGNVALLALRNSRLYA